MLTEIYFLDILDLLWYDPRQPEVTNLDSTLIIDEDIGWFEVSMHQACGMHEVEAA